MRSIKLLTSAILLIFAALSSHAKSLELLPQLAEKPLVFASKPDEFAGKPNFRAVTLPVDSSAAGGFITNQE